MIWKVLLGCGALILGGCAATGGAGRDVAYTVEESAAPAPAPPGEGYGYSFEEGPAVQALAQVDRAVNQRSVNKAKEAARDGGGAPVAPAAEPASVPLPIDPPPDPRAPDVRTDQTRKPLLIYKARLGLAVFRVQEQLDTIEKLAKERGGYLVARTQNEIRVRVPVQDFQASVDAILKLGDVHFRQVTTDDVTAEYTDLEIRLNNALSVRSRLQALLEKAQKVEEALEVERELQRLTDEIETMKGRLKLLQELAAYSTIDVAFSERSSQLQSRVRLPFPWLESMGLEHLLSL